MCQLVVGRCSGRDTRYLERVPDQSFDVSYVFAALHVKGRDAALAWYERLFDRAADFLQNDDEAVWQVAQTASVYLLCDGVRSGGGEVVLVVADLDGQRAALATRDISAEAIVVVPDAARKSRVLDPDGNMIWFIELTA
jgi:hypothetical protein